MKVFERIINRSFGLIKVVLIFLVIFMCKSESFCQKISGVSSNAVDVHQWIGEQFAKGKVPPFSFVYGGKSSDNFIRR